MSNKVDFDAPKEKRNAYLIGVIGTNRTGKTTKVEEIIKKYKKANPKNEIVGFDPQNRLADYITYRIEDIHDMINVFPRKDALVVLDDYRELFHSDSTHTHLLKLLGVRDEHGLDIVYVTHHPALILQRLSYYTTHLFIHFCNLAEEVEGMSKKVTNKKLVEYLFNDIEQEVVNNGGLDNGGGGKYPNFKHIVFYNQMAQFKRVNYK